VAPLRDRSEVTAGPRTLQDMTAPAVRFATATPAARRTSAAPAARVRSARTA
jgi:hypothetical protein